MAEKEGFEPSIQFPIYTLSRGTPSATRPLLRANIRQSLIQKLSKNQSDTGPFEPLAIEGGIIPYLPDNQSLNRLSVV